MTVLDPIADPSFAHAFALQPALPGRPSSRDGVRRSWHCAAFDAVAHPFGRWLGRFAWARALYRAQLARAERRDVELPIAGERGAGLRGLRVAFLSDLHAGAYVDRADLTALFDRVTAAAPDLVCLGGDLIDTRPEQLELYDGPLQRLRAPLGVCAVPGNHDHRWMHDIGEWAEFLEARGVRVLANRGFRIVRNGSTLWLAGVDDLTDGEPDVPRALFGRAHGEPTLVLAHQPDHFDELRRHGVDLVLSGHTHGGQFRVLGRSPITHTRFGWIAGGFGCPAGGGARLHVSRGVGVTILPLRIGARPEITVVRFTSAG
ncbi:MAG: metallophosphoesterase [Planctomycetes bacterium]|nr:metallophosphoesterase [Planctomycetota bacterium]